MKKYLQRVMLVAIAIATAQMAVAESWRINNDTSKGAHFASINDAMASSLVVDGDVLYLDPGCVLSDNQIVKKAVTIIGTGWDFNDRPYGYAQIKGSYFEIKAAAKIYGVHVSTELRVNANNVVVERCRIDGKVSGGNYDYNKLISSYVNGLVDGRSYWEIYNCIIIASGYSDQPLKYLKNASVINCYIEKVGQPNPTLSNVSNSTFKNNVIINNSNNDYRNLIEQGCEGNTFSNNCLSADETSTYTSTNVCANSKDVSTFILNDGAVGGAAYKLCEGSPAKEAGEGGVDCGPYAEGSLYPFVTYGMPKHIPYFTEASVPAQPTDGKVKVSLKIVNQNK